MEEIYLRLFDIIWAILIINSIISVTVIVLERKKPEKTIAWLLVFVIMPPVGLFFYIFLGRNWKKHKLNENTNLHINELMYESLKQIRNPEYYPIIKLISRNSESPLFMDNSIEIFKDGVEKFAALKQELKKAQHHIHLEYYIVKSDEIGNEIKDILIRKANEGVQVRFIIDRVGSIKIKKSYIKELQDNGVEVVQYSYFLAPFLRDINTQINYRNHRKIVIIDGKVGFLGGINIGDEYLGRGKLGYWRDTHMMVKGDFVLGLQAVFLDDFANIKKANKEDFSYNNQFDKFFPETGNYDGKRMQIIQSGPDSEFPSIMQAELKMISMAKKNIFITTPYFVPSDCIINALKISKLGGARVCILFPEQYDHFLVHYASRTYLKDLASCGVEIYLYDAKSFLHAKSMSIDGELCTIGTANMDIRSHELNYEINGIVYDEETTKKLDSLFYEDIKNSTLINEEYFNKQPVWIKYLEAICRIFSSLL
ncbi:cardiolipin synthase [Clostridium sp. JN-9]|nr:cardiolipin synthase [Clostridium sp. JN-9]